VPSAANLSALSSFCDFGSCRRGINFFMGISGEIGKTEESAWLEPPDVAGTANGPFDRLSTGRDGGNGIAA
jgi:hypothetical protein